ncbi:MAG: hypothetical protein AB1758_10475 [Candidatus Eremiobacterota bacterium]
MNASSLERRAHILAGQARDIAERRRPCAVDHSNMLEAHLKEQAAGMDTVATMLDPGLASPELIGNLQDIARRLVGTNQAINTDLKLNMVQSAMGSLARCLQTVVAGSVGVPLSAPLFDANCRRHILSNMALNAERHEGPCALNNTRMMEWHANSKLHALDLIVAQLDPGIVDAGVIQHARKVVEKLSTNQPGWDTGTRVGVVNSELLDIRTALDAARTDLPAQPTQVQAPANTRKCGLATALRMAGHVLGLGSRES